MQFLGQPHWFTITLNANMLRRGTAQAMLEQHIDVTGCECVTVDCETLQAKGSRIPCKDFWTDCNQVSLLVRLVVCSVPYMLCSYDATVGVVSAQNRT